VVLNFQLYIILKTSLLVLLKTGKTGFKLTLAKL